MQYAAGMPMLDPRRKILRSTSSALGPAFLHMYDIFHWGLVHNDDTRCKAPAAMRFVLSIFLAPFSVPNAFIIRGYCSLPQTHQSTDHLCHDYRRGASQRVPANDGLDVRSPRWHQEDRIPASQN